MLSCCCVTWYQMCASASVSVLLLCMQWNFRLSGVTQARHSHTVQNPRNCSTVSLHVQYSKSACLLSMHMQGTCMCLWNSSMQNCIHHYVHTGNFSIIMPWWVEPLWYTVEFIPADASVYKYLCYVVQYKTSYLKSFSNHVVVKTAVHEMSPYTKCQVYVLVGSQ